MARFHREIVRVFRLLDIATKGYADVVRMAVVRFDADRGAEAAAGMAYFIFFSLFPLILLFIYVGSFFLEQEDVYRTVLDTILASIPVSRQLIETNLQQVLEARGTVGLVGLVGTLWSALGAFKILESNLNRAWPRTRVRSFISRHLLALGMTLLAALLLGLSLFSTAFIGLLQVLELPGVLLPALRSLLGRVVSLVISWAFSFALFVVVYRWMPNTHVRWPIALRAALVTAVFWEVALGGFAWYVGSGLVQYELVYGSLGALVALLFWIFVGSMISLFGAYLGGAMAERDAARRAA